jgi:hypothetical protein
MSAQRGLKVLDLQAGNGLAEQGQPTVEYGHTTRKGILKLTLK